MFVIELVRGAADIINLQKKEKNMNLLQSNLDQKISLLVFLFQETISCLVIQALETFQTHQIQTSLHNVAQSNDC